MENNSKQSFCHECGTKLAIECKFCPSCGTRLVYPMSTDTTETPKPEAEQKPAPTYTPKTSFSEAEEYDKNYAKAQNNRYSYPERVSTSFSRSSPPPRVQKPIVKRWWFWVLVCAVAAYAVILFGDFGDTLHNYRQTKQSAEYNSPTPSTKSNARGVDPEFKKLMDSYEQFFDEGIEILNAYTQNPTDLQLLMKYMEFMEKYEEVLDALYDIDSDDLNEQELAYYLSVLGRIEQKMLDILD